MLAGHNPFRTSLRAALAPKLWATLWMTLGALLLALPALAQDQDSEADPADPSIETDISEDNYRRYMELKDPRLERPAFPSTVFKPPSSLEKMAQLPESSQKHLRNELRGIILQSGPWTPAELEREYRFTPSAAAQRDGQLLRAEAEAWAELVGEYHEREAASLAGNPGGSAPANAQNPATDGAPENSMASNQGSGNPGQDQQSGGDQQGQGEEGAGGDARNANDSSDGSNRRTASEETWQDPADGPAAGMSTEGVAQSASDLLRERGLAREDSNAPVPDQLSGQANNTASGEDSQRWGAEYRTVLPPAPTPGSENTAQTPPAEAPGPRDAGQGTLTLEELREVQGVTVALPFGEFEFADEPLITQEPQPQVPPED